MSLPDVKHTTKHSKLPWILKNNNGDIEVLSSDNEIVCNDEAYYPVAVTEENMYFIVQACNNFYPLVEALKLACEEIEHLRKFAGDNGAEIEETEYLEGRSLLRKLI